VLISNAYAQANDAGQAVAGQAAMGGGSPMAQILFFAMIIAVFYFLMIRPQMKRAKEHKSMVDALSKGDEIITGGGIAGKVVEVGDNFVQVEIAANTVVTIQKQTITAVLPKGTLKTL
jgi:preprotein translocase subunit YajC